MKEIAQDGAGLPVTRDRKKMAASSGIMPTGKQI